MSDDNNIEDLGRRRREKKMKEAEESAEREEEERKAAYKVIDREVDALIRLQPSFEGAIEALGQVDEGAALKLASDLLWGMCFDEDDQGVTFNVWDRAKECLNLPTLARAAQMLRVYEAEDVVSDLLDADARRHAPIYFEAPRPLGSRKTPA
jgi:hypothetical protein